MAPNPKAIAALRAMKSLGILEEKVKPVLKKLLRLYEKNWELIEEDNYRVLIDAIFEDDDTKVDEAPVHEEPHQLKRNTRLDSEHNPTSGGTSQGEENQVHEESGRPLKRLCLKHQVPPSVSEPKVDNELRGSETHSQSQSQDGMELGKSSIGNVGGEIQPSPTRHYVRNKGKQLALPQETTPGVCIKEPTVDKGVVLIPNQSAVITRALIIPKDEPVDQTSEYEVPTSVTNPDTLSNGYLSGGNVPAVEPGGQEITTSICMDVRSRDKGALDSPCQKTTHSKAATVPVGTLYNLDIASSTSSLGMVKVSLSCSTAISDFKMPSFDEVVKLMEDNCLRSYKIPAPKFCVTKFMEDMCECVLDLATDATRDSREREVGRTPPLEELLKKPPATEVFGLVGNVEKLHLPSGNLSGLVNIPCSTETPAQEITKILPSTNTSSDHLQGNEKTILSADAHSYEANELEDSSAMESHSLVVVPSSELTHQEIMSLHYINDITRGQEQICIAWVNEITRECPPSFYYIPQNLVFQNADVTFRLSHIGDNDCCSTCMGNCLSSSGSCSCARGSGGVFAYTSEGLLRDEFLDKCISMSRDPQQQQQFYCQDCPLERPKKDGAMEVCRGHLKRKFIRECFSKCGCNKQCGNRVVQRGISCKLQVFLTPQGKGWGLRTLENLQKGAFVCEYVGEILTNMELYERNLRSSHKHTYSVLLDADWESGAPKNEKALCLDAKDYGNIARFINHRCLDANLVEIPVEVETPGGGYYHFAFFTTRKIDALEELTWDYGLDFDDQDHHIKPFQCECCSKYCRNMKRATRSRSKSISS